MVNIDLIFILDGLKVMVDPNSINPEILYFHFHKKNYLDIDEIYKIVSVGIPTNQINAFFDTLKSKPDEIFVEIQKLANVKKWNYIYDYVKSNLKAKNFTSLLCKTDELNGSNLKDDIEKIRNNLKVYLRDEMKIIFEYWNNMDVTRVDNWKNFYSSDISFTDKSGKSLKISNFADLFEGQTFKRIIIYAPAGYGKSTFVHEMVRQWVNNYNWAKQFPLVYLFRLGDILPDSNCSDSNPLSLAGLFKICLMDQIFQLFSEEMYSNSLFVFDGFDELQRELISPDVYDLIVGRSMFKPYVIVTTRPDESFKDLKGPGNIYIELKGFTKEGVLNQFQKSGLHFQKLDLSLDIAKVPLFVTLFLVLLQDENTILTNPCSLIDKAVKHLLARYKENNPNFSSDKETQLLSILGQAAQAQFRYFRLYNGGGVFYPKINPIESILMPNFFASQNRQYLKAAKAAHLILPSSNEYEIYFPHKMFADYFAAFFWCNNKQEKCFYSMENFTFRIKTVGFYSYVYFENNFCCISTSWFSAFLSFFNKVYKIALWKTLETSTYYTYIPLFNNYEDLPCIQVKGRVVDFSYLSHQMACLAMEKLKFSSYSVVLWKLRFDSGCLFNNLSNVKELKLRWCPIKFSGQHFISAYNVESVILYCCTFEGCGDENTSNYLFESQQDFKLKRLAIYNPRGQVSNFLSEIIKACKNFNMLHVSLFVDFDWINLLKNKTILEGKISLSGFDYPPIKTVDDAVHILKTDFMPSNYYKHFDFKCEFV